jgi:hypothetical protein
MAGFDNACSRDLLIVPFPCKQSGDFSVFEIEMFLWQPTHK